MPQLGLIQNRDPSSLHFQYVLAAQLLNDPVHVNDTGSDGIGKKCLGEREAEGPAMRPTDCFQPAEKFDDNVGDSAGRVALPNVADPLAEDRSIGQSVAPQRLRDFGRLL